MICWYCYWGWPKPLMDIYEKYDKLIDAVIDDIIADQIVKGEPELQCPRTSEEAFHCGPGRSVWCQENFDRAAQNIGLRYEWFSDWPPMVLQLIDSSLEEVAALDSEYLVPPKGYDGEHPENYPPPSHWIMIPAAEVHERMFG